MKIVNIGNTKTEVKITHAKRSLVYFIDNLTNIKLLQYQKEILKYIKPKEEDKQ